MVLVERFGQKTSIVPSRSRERLILIQRHCGLIGTWSVLINTLASDPLAPFGGFKQSGIGRELGVAGLEAYLEPKSILGTAA
jgi:acyl-CoA reductase-like NAD-dependent aldehyde dehydrogenase